MTGNRMTPIIRNKVGTNWTTAPQPDLEAAIASFKAEFPGWWYSLGECEKSCDASCAPTRESEDIALIDLDERFDSGFHADLLQPSTLAQALETVMREARTATLAAHDTLARHG